MIRSQREEMPVTRPDKTDAEPNLERRREEPEPAAPEPDWEATARQIARRYRVVMARLAD